MILDRFRLDGRVAMVTGAGKGIGAGSAVALAEAGADVVLAARTESDLKATAERVEAVGQRAVVVPTDVLERDQLEGLVAAAREELGRIDILVNNAGGWPPHPAMRTSESGLEKALRFNAVMPFVLSRLAVPVMVETAGAGAIVNISSRSGSMVQPAMVAYGAGKAALNMITRNLAGELAPKVRVNAIECGGVETDALASVLTDDSIRARMEANTPMGRAGQVEDIAAAVLYLASDASGWVTGKVIEVDGGVEHPAFAVPVEPL